MSKKTIIKNGTIHDGQSFIGQMDLLFDGDKIQDIGSFENPASDLEIIDASGYVVAPGFIDTQNMMFNIDALDMNSGSNLVFQGVTSTITGNCGNSGNILSGDTFNQRLDQLEKIRLGINIGVLVGHNSLRKFVVNKPERVAVKDEIDSMNYILESALERGYLGMSSGLMYSPGIFASKEELYSLVSTVGKHHKVYATHMRDEGEQLEEAVLEAIDTAKTGGSKLLVSHLKVTGKKNWGKSTNTLKLIENKRMEQDIYLNFYPYSATNTVLSIVLLPSILQKIDGDLTKLKFDYEDEQIIEAEGKQNLCLNGWDDIVITTSQVSEIVGKSIQQIANGRSPYLAVTEILRKDPNTRVLFHNIASDADFENIAADRFSMVATDGYVYPLHSKDATHPRNYGSFSHAFQQFVISKHIYSLEEFIRRSSSVPANIFGLSGRGVIKTNSYADLIIFDPNKIRENATYEKPYLLSEGMQYVFVNGVPVLEKGRPIDNYPGSRL